MKCVWFFLVLALVLFMAEPGDAWFSKIRAAGRALKKGYRAEKFNLDMQKMNKKYGGYMQSGMKPGMQSGMQPGMQPGWQSGMQPGMQPGRNPSFSNYQGGSYY